MATTNAVAATCTTAGKIAGKQCSVCKEVITAQKAIPAKGHKYGAYKTTTKAGFNKKGVRTSVCQNSGCKNKKTKTIAALKALVLAATEYTFDNKVKKPAVTVKTTAGTKVSGTVTYDKGRKAVGKYVVKVTVNNANYNGTKTVYFKINPKVASNVKLTKGKKQFTVKWSKPNATYRKQITGYQVKYAVSAAKLKNAKPVTVKGTNYYSKWSAQKTVVTKQLIIQDLGTDRSPQVLLCLKVLRL